VEQLQLQIAQLTQSLKVATAELEAQAAMGEAAIYHAIQEQEILKKIACEHRENPRDQLEKPSGVTTESPFWNRDNAQDQLVEFSDTVEEVAWDGEEQGNPMDKVYEALAVATRSEMQANLPAWVPVAEVRKHTAMSSESFDEALGDWVKLEGLLMETCLALHEFPPDWRIEQC